MSVSTRRINSYTWRMLLPTIRIAEICLSILFARINSPITLRVTFILPPPHIRFNMRPIYTHSEKYEACVLLVNALWSRLLARRASRRPGTPLEQKMDAFGRPNSGGKEKLFSIISLLKYI